MMAMMVMMVMTITSSREMVMNLRTRRLTEEATADRPHSRKQKLGRDCHARIPGCFSLFPFSSLCLAFCRSPDFKKFNRSNKKIWRGYIIR